MGVKLFYMTSRLHSAGTDVELDPFALLRHAHTVERFRDRVSGFDAWHTLSGRGSGRVSDGLQARACVLRASSCSMNQTGVQVCSGISKESVSMINSGPHSAAHVHYVGSLAPPRAGSKSERMACAPERVTTASAVGRAARMYVYEYGMVHDTSVGGLG